MTAEPYAPANEADAPPVPDHRGLKMVVIVLGVLLVVGFIALLLTIIYRAVNLGSGEGAARPAAGASFDEAVALPPGGQIQAVSLDGDRLVVEVADGGASRLLIVLDVRRGREIGRFRLKTP